jgi:hypothetical protein
MMLLPSMGNRNPKVRTELYGLKKNIEKRGLKTSPKVRHDLTRTPYIRHKGRKQITIVS